MQKFDPRLIVTELKRSRRAANVLDVAAWTVFVLLALLVCLMAAGWIS